MQRQTSLPNRSLCFNINLFLTSGQLQHFHVAGCKVLGDVDGLALGKVEIGEVASLRSSRTDVGSHNS